MSKDNIAQQYNNMVASIEDAKIYDGRGEYNLSISEGLFNDKHPYRTYDYAGRIDCGTNEELFLAIAAL